MKKRLIGLSLLFTSTSLAANRCEWAIAQESSPLPFSTEAKFDRTVQSFATSLDTLMQHYHGKKQSFAKKAVASAKLLVNSEALLKSHGVRYQGTIDGLQILPDAKGHALNKLAKTMKERFDVTLFFEGEGNMKNGYHGAYQPWNRRIFIDPKSLVQGRVTDTIVHEFRHAYIDHLVRTSDYLFSGAIFSTNGKPMDPRLQFYKEYMSLQELDTFSYQLGFQLSRAKVALRKGDAKQFTQTMEQIADATWMGLQLSWATEKVLRKLYKLSFSRPQDFEFVLDYDRVLNVQVRSQGLGMHLPMPQKRARALADILLKTKTDNDQIMVMVRERIAELLSGSYEVNMSFVKAFNQSLRALEAIEQGPPTESLVQAIEKALLGPRQSIYQSNKKWLEKAGE